MKFKKLRRIFLEKITQKFKKDYKININRWFPNPYLKIKYKYIFEFASIFSYIFYKTNIVPNVITLLNILLAIVALAIFSLNINDLKYIGIFIFFSKNVLDNVDGFIAREKKLISLTGKKLDEVSGHVYYYSIFLSLIFHSYYLTDNIIILFFGFFIILLDLINLIYNKQEKNSIKKNKSKLFKKIY